MKPERFTALVRSVFGPTLDKHGFRLVDEAYYPESFGDVYLDFESADFGLRFCTDRGYYIIYVRPLIQSVDKWDLWIGLSDLFEFMRNKMCATLLDPQDDETGWNAAAMVCLEDAYDDLKTLFGPASYEKFKISFDRWSHTRFLLRHPGAFTRRN